MRKLKLFFMNSMLLSITSILMRAIGVAFNVYISNEIGMAGMGLIELIVTVFSFAVVLAVSGVSLASTRLVAEEMANNSDTGIRKSMRSCITYSLIFGISSAILMLCTSNFIGTYFLGDTRTIKSLLVLSISLPLIAVQSALYGYFTAVRRVAISAGVQIVEQLIRIGLTVYLLQIFIPYGVEYACLGLIIASSIAEMFSFVALLIFYEIDKKRFSAKTAQPINIRRRLLKISLPIAFSSYVCSALYMIKNIMIPIGLIKSGLTRDGALAQFGIISGMVIPIIFFPSAFLSAFSSMIVPEITECYKLGNMKRINYMISRAFQVTLLFSIGVIGIFLKFPHDFGIVIFKSLEIGIYIKILAPLILIMYLDSVVDAMLKGLDKQVSSMFYNIIDSIIGIALVYLLLPKFGIKGLLLVMFSSKLINAFLSINKIIKVTSFKIDIMSWLIKPCLAIFMSVTSVKLFTDFMHIGYNPSVTLLICYVLFSIIIYYIILRLLDCINKDDLLHFKGIFK